MEKYDFNMTCQQVQDQLDEFIDVELSATAAREIEEHCRQCPTCHEELLIAQQVRDELKQLPILCCPQEVTTNAWRQIMEDQRHDQPRWAWLTRWRVAALCTALAAMFLLVIRLPGVVTLPPASAPVGVTEQEAQMAAKHILYAFEQSADALAMVMEVNRDNIVEINKIATDALQHANVNHGPDVPAGSI